MKKILAAIALSIAIPAVAHAQAAPAPKKEDCCEKMKAEGKKCCCDDMDKKDHGERGMNHGESGSTEHAH